MNLPHRIEIIEPKKLIGFSIETSFQEDKTPIVWRKLMIRRDEMVNRISDKLFSLQIYPENFAPNQPFKKYALAEVSDFKNIPDEFESFNLIGGKYIVFNYKGKAENGSQIFRYIFQTFIPNRHFEVDNRPHFETFDDTYNPLDGNAQEEIWIPIN